VLCGVDELCSRLMTTSGVTCCTCPHSHHGAGVVGHAARGSFGRFGLAPGTSPRPREPLDSPVCPKPAYSAETVLRTSEFPLIAQYGLGGGAIVVAVIEILPKTPSV
jgi:hypothetical protein